MRKLRIASIFLSCALLLLLLSAACAPEAGPIAAPAPPTPAPSVAPVAPVPARAAWEEEWEKWMEGAKKEGGLVLHTSGGVTVRTGLCRAFKEKFGIDAEVISGRSAELGAKLLAERRAGLYLVDVLLGGSIPTALIHLKPAGVFDPLKPVLILPEVLDTSVWWGGELRFLDTEKRYNLALTTYISSPMSVNTELVKPGEIKSYRDLLNPKWKGKIIINDPTKGGTGGKLFGVLGSRILGWDFWREMVKQEPIILTDQRLMADWVARGKYAIVFGGKTDIEEEYIRVGAPLSRLTPIEGGYLTSGSGTVCLINRAPHPNAARVFINWLATKEGSTVLSRSLASPATRLDVPTEGLDPELLVKPGMKYVISDDEEFGRDQEEHARLAKEIFGHLLK